MKRRGASEAERQPLPLVDDDESSREVLLYHIVDEGYQVDTAADGRAARVFHF